MFRVRALAAACCVALISSAALAQTQAKSAPKTSPLADPRALIAGKVGDVKPEDVRLTVVPGIYEVARAGDIAYVTSDGRFAFAGDLYDLDQNANLTENRRRASRRELLGNIPENEMIVFAPKDAKHFVTVFTDIDCGYCQRMHTQIAEYNRLGIGVRYLLYPRAGPGSEAWEKAERVWCADNRRDALTRAKRGEKIKSPKCQAGVIARDYALGEQLSVRGTPSIILASGELIPGYLPPAGLANALRSPVTK
jgi:thiol:disulfide interchange protein DsbC